MAAESVPIARPLRSRQEPRGCTVADLLALVLGVAGAAALERASGRVDLLGPAFDSSLGWRVVLDYVLEGLRMGLVALMPVGVFRRVCYGGAMRPAEYLALGSGLQILWEYYFVTFLALHQETEGTEAPITLALHAPWEWIVPLVSLLAVALAAAFRRRLAPWVTAGLLGGAMFALWPVESLLNRGKNAIPIPLAWEQLPLWAYFLRDDLFAIPSQAIRMVPLALAALAPLHHSRSARNWVEWVCPGLALMLLCCLHIKVVLLIFATEFIQLPTVIMVIDLIALVVEAVLALAIVRRFGPGVGRWFGLVEPPVQAA